MSIIDIVFPLVPDDGVQGRIEHGTTIGQSTDGHEVRNARGVPVRVYEVEFGSRTKAETKTLRNFFLDMQGELDGFLWKDYADFESDTAQSLGTGTGALTTFQLVKAYANSGSSKTPQSRTITRPKSGTVLVYLDGVIQTETTHYTVNYTTGVITFLSAPGLGVVVTAEFEFYVPARFDDFSVDVDRFSVFSSSATIIEILE